MLTQRGRTLECVGLLSCVLYSAPTVSSTSVKTAEPDDVPEVASHTGKEPGKTGRKKDASGEGGSSTPKKEKKLKAQGGRLKNKPSAQAVQVSAAEPTDGLVASLTVIASCLVFCYLYD